MKVAHGEEKRFPPGSIPPLNANETSKSISTETTVMSELEVLESTWDFSELHAELDVIC
jgi:hypothetical protein